MIDKISIVMPTYNAMPFLPEAVESILSQSFDQFEFLIVNDGSTDGSRTYLDSLLDPRIRVIHQKNRGIVVALNTGIEEAQYKWIARMDADDVALPQRIETELSFLNNNPQYALVSCGFGYIGKNGRRMKATHATNLSLPTLFQPLVDPMILDQGMIFRKDAVLSCGGYQGSSLAEGMDLCLRLDESGYLINSIPDILMLVRVLPAGVSSTNFIEQRVAWKYARACSKARREGLAAPDWKSFFRENQPRGWKRIRVEGTRQFRLAGASWGADEYLQATFRLVLSFILRPKLVVSKFAIYFFNTRSFNAN